MWRSPESFSSFLLLVNYSTKVSVSWAKEEMELLARLVYHWRARPWRLEPKLLHIFASCCSHGMAAVNIRCL